MPSPYSLRSKQVQPLSQGNLLNAGYSSDIGATQAATHDSHDSHAAIVVNNKRPAAEDPAIISAVSSAPSSDNQNKENHNENANDEQYTATPLKKRKPSDTEKERIARHHFKQSFSERPLPHQFLCTVPSPKIPEEKDLTSVYSLGYKDVPIVYAPGKVQLEKLLKASLGGSLPIRSDNKSSIFPTGTEISNSIGGIAPVSHFPNTTVSIISNHAFKEMGFNFGLQNNPQAMEFIDLHRIDDTLDTDRRIRRSKFGVQESKKKFYIGTDDEGRKLFYKNTPTYLTDMNIPYTNAKVAGGVAGGNQPTLGVRCPIGEGGLTVTRVCLTSEEAAALDLHPNGVVKSKCAETWYSTAVEAAYDVNWKDASGLSHRHEFVSILGIIGHFEDDYKCGPRGEGLRRKLKKAGLSKKRGGGNTWSDLQRAMTARLDFTMKNRVNGLPPITITITRHTESYA